MEMANTDPLTGLPNRRAIEEWPGGNYGARRVTDFLSGSCTPMWIVFKDINDAMVTMLATCAEEIRGNSENFTRHRISAAGWVVMSFCWC